MDAQKLESLPPPPGVIGSLRAWFRCSCKSRLADRTAAGAGHFPMAGAAFERGWVAATVRQIYVPAGPQRCGSL
jgi:hypothetical protein